MAASISKSIESSRKRIFECIPKKTVLKHFILSISSEYHEYEWYSSYCWRGMYQFVTENFYCFRNTKALSWFFGRAFVSKIWQSFRMVVWWKWYQRSVKFMRRWLKVVWKFRHARNPSALTNFFTKALWERYENPVKRWLRKPCQRVITKALSKGDYESLVETIREPCQALNAKVLSKGWIRKPCQRSITKA